MTRRKSGADLTREDLIELCPTFEVEKMDEMALNMLRDQYQLSLDLEKANIELSRKLPLSEFNYRYLNYFIPDSPLSDEEKEIVKRQWLEYVAIDWNTPVYIVDDQNDYEILFKIPGLVNTEVFMGASGNLNSIIVDQAERNNLEMNDPMDHQAQRIKDGIKKYMMVSNEDPMRDFYDYYGIYPGAAIAPPEEPQEDLLF